MGDKVTVQLSQQRSSVFLTEDFLRPGTHVFQFGRKLKALDAFFVQNFDVETLKKLGFRPNKIENLSRRTFPGPLNVLLDASYNGSRKITE